MRDRHTGEYIRPRARVLLPLLVVLPLLLAGVCEGDGDGSSGPEVRVVRVDPRCSPLAGEYPSGFDLLPSGGRAVVMQFNPPALLAFDLSSAPPRILSPQTIPALPLDSDGDGVDDAVRHRELGFCPAGNPGCDVHAIPGSVTAAADDLALVSASSYEQVMFFHPLSGTLTALWVENPSSTRMYRAGDRPLLPPEGTGALRTAVSTRACVYPPTSVDSLDREIAPDPRCGAGAHGYFTKFTAGKTLAAGRLFVAMSNKKSGARYYPGTVLVYEFETGGPTPTLRPDVDRPVIFTTAFNPTSVTRHVNALGRELVLVTATGAITLGWGSESVLTASAVDVIDAQSLRLVATIPLGRAGPAFGDLAIDPSGRLALLGAAAQRRLYAIDLAPLDDPALYEPRDEPVVLDGSTSGFPDARIFDAEAPFEIPHLGDGPPASDCGGQTHVAINTGGDLAYVSDWCDGSLTVVGLDLEGAGPPPLSPDRFDVRRVLALLAPKTAAHFGQLTAPGMVEVRSGRPGVDFSGPDVFFIANEPEGQLCAIRVEP